jgi:hypothetical protein
MHVRMLAVALAIGFIVGCNCGGGMSDPCAGTKCGPGLVCDPVLAKCVVDTGAGGGGTTGTGGGTTGTGGGTGGGTASDGGAGGGQDGTCTQTCGGSTPVCDAANDRCVICTSTAGCGGATPICFTEANGGLGRCMACLPGQGCGGDTPLCDVTIPPAGGCYQCDFSFQCDAGLVCDPNSRRCVVDDGGFGGGPGGSGGTTVVWGDGGVTTRCLGLDAGTAACSTNAQCREGWECIGGQCVLRGSKGAIQVTLRWPLPEDLDLYLVEPLPDGGSCEIFYGNPNVDASVPFPLPIPLPPGCGALGWLDLDSNAACRIDNVDVENIIFPPQQTPTPGRYTVRVNYYQNCNSPPSVPYEVEVRANGQTRFFCGSFTPSQANGGGKGAGTVITTFDIQ